MSDHEAGTYVLIRGRIKSWGNGEKDMGYAKLSEVVLRESGCQMLTRLVMNDKVGAREMRASSMNAMRASTSYDVHGTTSYGMRAYRSSTMGA